MTPRLRINSPGGMLFEGVALYNQLKNKGLVAQVDGMAFSAASLLFLAGESRVIATGAQLLVHQCWSMVVGNADDLTKAATEQGKLDAVLADIYAANANKQLDAAFFAALMREDRLMDAAEAAKLFLATEAESDRDSEDNSSSAEKDDEDAENNEDDDEDETENAKAGTEDKAFAIIEQWNNRFLKPKGTRK